MKKPWVCHVLSLFTSFADCTSQKKAPIMGAFFVVLKAINLNKQYGGYWFLCGLH
ncbi:MAG: hypothetical protein ACK5JF_04115 [Oscillospiraceae bacterium]